VHGEGGARGRALARDGAVLANSADGGEARDRNNSARGSKSNNDRICAGDGGDTAAPLYSWTSGLLFIRLVALFS